MTAALLADRIAGAARVSVIGMAKNAGKTRTLVALVEELDARGLRVGLTSVGRDGERDDVLDPRIPKPPVPVPPGGLVATSERFLRQAGMPYEVLAHSGYSTPVGNTVIAFLPYGGSPEIAGPSSNAATARVCDAMLALGADQVIIDGAFNRRAAASPAVADVVILATGATLHRSLNEVVALTVAAAELMTLPKASAPQVIEAAAVSDGSVVITGTGEVMPLHRRVTLGGVPEEVERLFGRPDGVSHVLLGGALCEAFVEEARRAARGREVRLVARDSSRVFLSARSSAWYLRQNVSIEVLRPTALAGLTVNPVAPLAYRFDSTWFLKRMAAELVNLPVCDLGPHTS